MSRTPPPGGGVMVTHPGRQHVYETVLAAQESELLYAFATSVHFGRPAGQALVKMASQMRPRGAVIRGAMQRSNHAIDPKLVVTFPYRALAARVVRRSLIGAASQVWVRHGTDAAIARWLSRSDQTPSVVHGFEGGCLETFRVAKSRGCITVLDVPNAHEYATQALLAEGDREPRRGFETARVRAERESADYLLAPSQFVVRCLVEHGVSAKRIVLLPYGADINPRGSSEQRRDDGVFRLLFVGQVGARKGIRYLLDAWDRLELAKAELILVGGADKIGRALLRRSRHGTTWIGQVPSSVVRSWFSRADVFAFPSLAEGSALVTYEAMASGLPVVTTPCSGSVVRDGIDGFIIEPRNVDALLDRLVSLREDRQLRRAMGEAGRLRIETSYTWCHYRKRLVQLYSDLLAGRSPQADLRPDTNSWDR